MGDLKAVGPHLTQSGEAGADLLRQQQDLREWLELPRGRVVLGFRKRFFTKTVIGLWNGFSGNLSWH